LEVLLIDRNVAASSSDQVKCFPARRGGEPAWEGFRVLDPLEILKKAKPRVLDDIARVVTIEPVGPGDRPQQVREAVADLGPGLGVARGGPRHQFRQA
jgi:hypothetical protein